MSNILASLVLPLNVVIKFDLVHPRFPKIRRHQIERMCAEVRRAVQRWYYSEYC
jgi:hypothetical protein